jgi:hypothetical protein
MGRRDRPIRAADIELYNHINHDHNSERRESQGEYIPSPMVTSKGERTRVASKDDTVHDEMRTSPVVSIRHHAAPRENISTKSLES